MLKALIRVFLSFIEYHIKAIRATTKLKVPPLENVNKDWINSHTDRKNIIILSEGFLKCNIPKINAMSAPRLKVADTWFGPKPPLAAKLEVSVKITLLVIMEYREMVAIDIVGKSIESRTHCMRDFVIFML